MSNEPTNSELAVAIYTVNRHAKTAPNNHLLYELKHLAVNKMIASGRAKKLGIQFVEKSRMSKQQSSVLVECDDFYFHILPKKEDIQKLPHLGKLNRDYRNPKKRMSLSCAKKILITYTNYSEQLTPTIQRPKSSTMKFPSTYLNSI